MKDQSPLPSAVVVPIDVEPVKSSTLLFASAVPVNVGVLSLLRLSLLELPLSDAALKSGLDGAAGGVASMVRLSAGDAEDVLPAASVAFAVML